MLLLKLAVEYFNNLLVLFFCSLIGSIRVIYLLLSLSRFYTCAKTSPLVEIFILNEWIYLRVIGIELSRLIVVSVFD